MCTYVCIKKILGAYELQDIESLISELRSALLAKEGLRRDYKLYIPTNILVDVRGWIIRQS